MSADLTIKLVSSNAENISIHIEDLQNATVLTLKELIEKKDPQRFPINGQKLIFLGQILNDPSALLASYHVENGSAIHLQITRIQTPPAATSQANNLNQPSPLSTPSSTTTLMSYLEQINRENGGPTALQTLKKICENITTHPNEEKYRKLRIDNSALQSRLFHVRHAMECLRLIGFENSVNEPGFLILVPTAEKWEFIVMATRLISDAVSSSSPGSAFSSARSNTIPTNAAEYMQYIQQNPSLAQLAAQLVAQDPRTFNNAALAQAAQDPNQMARMISQMQHDPRVMQHLSQLLANRGGAQPPSMSNPFAPSGSANSPLYNPFAAPTSAMPSAPPTSYTATPNPTNSNPSATTPTIATTSTSSTTTVPPTTLSNEPSPNDDAFDEDEIARAIAQSLEEDTS